MSARSGRLIGIAWAHAALCVRYVELQRCHWGGGSRKRPESRAINFIIYLCTRFINTDIRDSDSVLVVITDRGVPLSIPSRNKSVSHIHKSKMGSACTNCRSAHLRCDGNIPVSPCILYPGDWPGVTYAPWVLVGSKLLRISPSCLLFAFFKFYIWGLCFSSWSPGSASAMQEMCIEKQIRLMCRCPTHTPRTPN